MKLILIKRVFQLFLSIILVTYCALISCKSGMTAKTSEVDYVQMSSKDTAKFNFENGEQDWKSQNWKDFRGNYGVEQTSVYSKSGLHALLFECDSTKNSKREAFVDLRKEFNAPLNLEGKSIKCWVLIFPSDAGNDGDRPDGVQLFVTSIKKEGTSNEQLFTEFGSSYSIKDRKGIWFEITLNPSIETPEGGYIEQGFDPKNIVIMGIRITNGTGSSSSFKGSLYIDDIDW